MIPQLNMVIVKRGSASDLVAGRSGSVGRDLGQLAHGLSRSCSLVDVLPKPMHMLRRNASFVDSHQQFSALQAMVHELRGDEVNPEPVTARVSVDEFSRKMQSFSTRDPFFEANTLCLEGHPGRGQTFYQGRPASHVRALTLEMDSVSPPWLDSTLNAEKIFPKLEALTVRGLNPAHVRILEALLNGSSTLSSLELCEVDKLQTALLPVLEGASASSVRSLVYAECEGSRSGSLMHAGLLDQQLLALIAACPELQSVTLDGNFKLTQSFFDQFVGLKSPQRSLPELVLVNDPELSKLANSVAKQDRLYDEDGVAISPWQVLNERSGQTEKVSLAAFEQKMKGPSNQDPIFSAKALHFSGDNTGSRDVFNTGRALPKVTSLTFELNADMPAWIGSTLNFQQMFPNLKTLTLSGLNSGHVWVLFEALNFSPTLRVLKLHNVDPESAYSVCDLLRDTQAQEVKKLVYSEREGVRDSELSVMLLDQQLLSVLAVCPELESMTLKGSFPLTPYFADTFTQWVEDGRKLPALLLEGDEEARLALIKNR